MIKRGEGEPRTAAHWKAMADWLERERAPGPSGPPQPPVSTQRASSSIVWSEGRDHSTDPVYSTVRLDRR